MIPSIITRDHLLQAIAHVDEHGVPSRRGARGYELLHDGKRYPPKYLVAVAAQLATGQDLSSEAFGGGNETNAFVVRHGFTVVPKGAPMATETQLRIAVISLRAGESTLEKQALKNATEACRNGHDGPLLLLFSGASGHWSGDPSAFQALMTHHHASALAELTFDTGSQYVGTQFGESAPRPQRIVQKVSGGKQADQHPELVAKVVAECEPKGPRRFELEGVQLGVIVCGENNILQSRQSQGNICEGIRNHPGQELLPGVDIVLNGAHTIMGNWSKLNHRFAWISKGHRVLAYCTNNTNKHSWSSAIRVFYDGERVADGNGPSPTWDGRGRFSPHLLKGPDFRAVVLDDFRTTNAH